MMLSIRSSRPSLLFQSHLSFELVALSLIFSSLSLSALALLRNIIALSVTSPPLVAFSVTASSTTQEVLITFTRGFFLDVLPEAALAADISRSFSLTSLAVLTCVGIFQLFPVLSELFDPLVKLATVSTIVFVKFISVEVGNIVGCIVTGVLRVVIVEVVEAGVWGGEDDFLFTTLVERV